MGDEELFQQIQEGNQQAFKEWLNRYVEQIAQFAFQYGVSLNDANEVTVLIFRKLFTEIEQIQSEQQLIYRMYQIAIETVKGNPLTDERELAFEEDDQLHQKIIHLETQIKLVLILHKFHKFDTTLIAEILDINNEETRQALAEGCKQLQETNIEKRFEFLGKSYRRIQIQVDEEGIFNRLGKSTADTSKKRISKRNVLIGISGIIVLAIMIIIATLSSEPFQKASTERWIQRLEESYEKELKNSFKELGVSPEDFAAVESPGRYSVQYLSNQYESRFNLLIERVERDLELGNRINKKEVAKEINEMIEEFQTPREMVDELFKAPLTNNLEASEEFLETYIAKLNIISEVYFNIIYSHPEYIGEATVNDVLDVEKYMGRIERYPEEVKQALKSMEQQQVTLKSLPEQSFPSITFKGGKFGEDLREVLHPNVSGYITLLELAPYYIYYYMGNELNMKESISLLKEWEPTLHATEPKYDMHRMLRLNYGWVLQSVLNGADEELYGNNGEIRAEIRDAWKEIADFGDKSPAAHIMNQVIDEFEETEWKVSVTQLFISDTQLMQVIENTENIKEVSLDIENSMHHSHVNLELPNNGYEYLVNFTYEQFKENYDQSVLRDSHPLVIAGIILSANEHEDAETIWHLYPDDIKPDTLKSFVANWKQEKVTLKDIKYLLYESYNYTVSYSKDDFYLDYIQLIESQDGYRLEGIYK